MAFIAVILFLVGVTMVGNKNDWGWLVLMFAGCALLPLM